MSWINDNKERYDVGQFRRKMSDSEYRNLYMGNYERSPQEIEYEDRCIAAYLHYEEDWLPFDYAIDRYGRSTQLVNKKRPYMPDYASLYNVSIEDMKTHKYFIEDILERRNNEHHYQYYRSKRIPFESRQITFNCSKHFRL